MSADLTYLVCLENSSCHLALLTNNHGVVFQGTPRYILPEFMKIDAVILTPNSRFLKGIKNHLRPKVAILTIRHS